MAPAAASTTTETTSLPSLSTMAINTLVRRGEETEVVNSAITNDTIDMVIVVTVLGIAVFGVGFLLFQAIRNARHVPFYYNLFRAKLKTNRFRNKTPIVATNQPIGLRFEVDSPAIHCDGAGAAGMEMPCTPPPAYYSIMRPVPAIIVLEDEEAHSDRPRGSVLPAAYSP